MSSIRDYYTTYLFQGGGGFGFGSFGFEDLFKDFAPMPGVPNKKGNSEISIVKLIFIVL